MEKKVLIILFCVLFFSCKEEIEEAEKIQFYISINDFELKNQSANIIENIPNIGTELGGGVVTCTNNTETFIFDTQETGIEYFLFELPAGIYNIEIESPAASMYGQSTPSFKTETIQAEISDLTDTIALNAEPTCALIVVRDDLNQLENEPFIIEYRSLNNDDFVSNTLKLDSISNSYYTYILPDTIPDYPNAFLWFYSEEIAEAKDGLHTEIFEIGYKYLIKVLE